jgi:hypothetical protein
MSRPLGIKIIAGLQFFYSGSGLVTSLGILGIIKLLKENFGEAKIKSLLAVFSDSGIPEWQRSTQFLNLMLFSEIILVWAIVAIVFSLIGILLGYGLLKLKGWAWIGTLILQIIQVLSNLPIFLISGDFLPQVISYLISVILPLVIIYYLLKQDVKQAFFRKKIV